MLMFVMCVCACVLITLCMSRTARYTVIFPDNNLYDGNVQEIAF